LLTVQKEKSYENVLFFFFSVDAEYKLDVHGKELRDEVAEDVRDGDDLDAFAGLAALAGNLPPARHGRRRGRDRGEDRTAETAHKRLRIVGAVHQAVLEHERDTVREQRVTFHLTKADTTSALTTLPSAKMFLLIKPQLNFSSGLAGIP